MEQLRYVVLHHTGIPDPHYDLMVEPGPGATALATWRVPAWPVRGMVVVHRLADHRAAYLTFEGDVTGNRGRVSRVRGGQCWVERDRDVFVVTFDRGEVVRLWPAGDGAWLAAPVGTIRAEPTDA